ncbi:MAG: GNAT family N-acetyltransferase [Candidatus Obscuribacterales bacterium]|nr:GNAT family N-acetyltransferase [Candidatus Obscuribacterales bacterium]
MTKPVHKRIEMIRETTLLDVSPSKFEVKDLTPSDGDKLGRLLYIAYKGTIDDEGGSETDAITEATETLGGRYGNVIWSASKIMQDGDKFISATVITNWPKLNPLLAFAATNPDYQRQGLSAQLIQMSLDSLHKLNIPVLHLVVTEGNEHAIRLYKRLGFQEDLACQKA